MTISKKFLAAILMVVFSFSLFSSVLTVNAEKTYNIKISAGDEEDATFDTSALPDTINAENVSIKKRAVKDEDGNVIKEVDYLLTISNLTYNQKLSFDAAKLIKVPDAGKYYVKGLRISGADKMENERGNTIVDLVVKANETYVAAYGIGSVIPYRVQYVAMVNGKEEEKYPEEILYGVRDEDVVVPARHIPDYSPDEIEKTVKLTDGTVVKFIYKDLPATVEYETKTETNTIYVTGEPTYSYEYQYVDGTTTVETTTNGGNGVTNNRAEGNANGANPQAQNAAAGARAQAGAAGAAGGEAGAAGEAAAAAAAGEGQEITTIDEGQTPLAGGDKEDGKPSSGEEVTPTAIPEPTPPLSGGKSLITKVVMTVTMITLVILVITTITTYIVRRRNN